MSRPFGPHGPRAADDPVSGRRRVFVMGPSIPFGRGDSCRRDHRARHPLVLGVVGRPEPLSPMALLRPRPTGPNRVSAPNTRSARRTSMDPRALRSTNCAGASPCAPRSGMPAAGAGPPATLGTQRRESRLDDPLRPLWIRPTSGSAHEAERERVDRRPLIGFDGEGWNAGLRWPRVGLNSTPRPTRRHDARPDLRDRSDALGHPNGITHSSGRPTRRGTTCPCHRSRSLTTRRRARA